MSAMTHGRTSTGVVHYCRPGGPQAHVRGELVRICITIRGNRIPLDVTDAPVSCQKCLAKRPPCPAHPTRKATHMIEEILAGEGARTSRPACDPCIARLRREDPDAVVRRLDQW